MRRTGLTAATALALLAGAASAAPPERGVLVPGRSLGGLELGATPAGVRAAWGTTFGRCRSCAATTWYFNRRPFSPQGAGVEFREGKASAIFTLWSPPGWRTSRGLYLGETEARVTQLYGALVRTECGGYAALTLRSARAATVFYVDDGRLWGFGLVTPGRAPCR